MALKAHLFSCLELVGVSHEAVLILGYQLVVEAVVLVQGQQLKSLQSCQPLQSCVCQAAAARAGPVQACQLRQLHNQRKRLHRQKLRPQTSNCNSLLAAAAALPLTAAGRRLPPWTPAHVQRPGGGEQDMRAQCFASLLQSSQHHPCHSACSTRCCSCGSTLPAGNMCCIAVSGRGCPALKTSKCVRWFDVVRAEQSMACTSSKGTSLSSEL